MISNRLKDILQALSLLDDLEPSAKNVAKLREAKGPMSQNEAKRLLNRADWDLGAFDMEPNS